MHPRLLHPRLAPRPRALRALLAPLLLGIGACASTPRTAPPAPFDVNADAYVGTALSGPLAEADPAGLEWDTAWMLSASTSWVPTVMLDGDPATGRLILVEGDDAAFGAQPRLASEVRLEGTPVRAEATWQQPFLEALAAGTTVVLRARPDAELADGPRVDWEALELEVTRPNARPDELEVVLVLAGQVTPHVDAEPGLDQVDAHRAGPMDVRESVLLHAAPTVDGDSLRLVLPAPTKLHPQGGFLIELGARSRLVDDGSRDNWLEACERGRERVARAHEAALERARGFEVDEGFRFESERALAALERRELRRSALIFLAQGTGAELTGELALVATPEDLGEFLAELGRRGPRGDMADGPDETGEPGDPLAPHEQAAAGAFGWFLERSAWSWLATSAQDEKRGLAPELRALLLRRAGELGRYPDLLLETLGASRDVDSMAAAIVDENRIFLEDAHPAARVRAFDWLSRHGDVPEGYDPLGAKDQRRAAIASWNLSEQDQ